MSQAKGKKVSTQGILETVKAHASLYIYSVQTGPLLCVCRITVHFNLFITHRGSYMSGHLI